MPYNTRRKSLSLPSLGIHIPVTHAARDAARAAAASATSTSSSPSKSHRLSNSSSSSATPSSATPAESAESHPSKRLKRAHPGPPPAEALEQTPPPSPTLAKSVEMADAPVTKIDLASVNDDIVEAVIVQLQTTGNRPHLVKDLATVLGQSLASVQQ